MKSFYTLPIFILCFCFKANSQEALFWNQYAAGNPAATGVNSNLSVSSITSLGYRNTIVERVNAEVRIKKLHGALGAGYNTSYSKDWLSGNGAYLNYSFHLKTGENSLIAFGANANYAVGNWQYFSTKYRTELFYAGLGVHYQYKNFKIGVAGRTWEDSYRHTTKFVVSDLYVDYTLKLGENWALNAAYHSGNSWNGGSSLMSRAIYKNKFWFGGSYDLRRNVGILAGVNLNDKWSIGYSINAGRSSSNEFQVANQSLSVKFQLPQK